jgi:bacillithiol synthase
MSGRMTLPRVLTSALGGSPLSLAMQRGDVPDLERPWPRSTEQWRTAATDVRRRFDGDKWLKQLAPAIGDTAAITALGRAAKDGVVVTTGQQAGLFGGHMLTLVKALSARALADAIERSTGIPTATVFWAATDDADFVEAASVKLPGTGEARTLVLGAPPPAGTPMASAPLSGVSPLLDAMESCCGSSAASMMSLLRRSYRDGSTVGDAYVELLRELLTPWGIAVLDASHPAVRQAARPLLAKALENAAEIERRVGERNEMLRSAGLSPQVESVPGLSLVFAYEQGIKRRIPLTEAKAHAATKTELGPTVLLRPVLESALLPTVAYAGGPGEIAYFAQIPPIAAALGAARPMAVPRWSTTIVEPGIERILDRYSVGVDDLRDFDGLLTRLVRDRMPADLTTPLTGLRRDIETAMGALMDGASRHGLDGKIVEGLQAQLAVRVDRGERRVVAALKRREADLRRDLGTARASLYPDGVRQERALSFIPFVARYDGPLIERMLAEAARHADQLVGATRDRIAPVAGRT